MRMRSLTPYLLLAALVFPRAQANAGPEGSYRWITPVVGWAKFSDRLIYPADSLKDSPLFGLRIGQTFQENWALELAGAYSPTKEAAYPDRDVTYMNGSLNLMYTPAHWKAGDLYLAAGGGYSRRKAKDFTDYHAGTFEQAIGFRSWWNDKAGIRLEARNSLNLANHRWERSDKSDLHFLAGIDFAFGGKPKDADGDGVPDKKDKCPNTPMGAKVDLTGCPTDADGDGVWDGLDKCPDTPKGAAVDATGCPKDSDGDGVYDGLDQCENTPKGAMVDAKGCPTDSDGDGVWDGLDKCPNTPKGAKVDADGCPTDTDGDGVFDGLDKCPETPKGAKVDADGCPIVVTEKETELLDTGMIRLQNVNFETGKSDLLPESKPILDDIGPILRKWPQLQIEVGGHTDSRGTDARNQALSEARANSVRNYLIQKFPDIVASQLSAKGYGESKPIAPNKGAANMAKNRRVEFVVLNKDVLKKEVEKRKMLQK